MIPPARSPDRRPPLTIRPLRADDAQAFWNLRLQTFTDHPDFFGTTREEWLAKSPARAAVQFEDPQGLGAVMLGAFEEGQLIGHVGLDRDPRQKRRHRAKLFALAVAPDLRGRGTGRALVEALIAHARTLEGVEKLLLTVMAHNARAIALYQAVGFRRCGFEEDALRWNGQRFAEETFELSLR